MDNKNNNLFSDPMSREGFIIRNYNLSNVITKKEDVIVDDRIVPLYTYDFVFKTKKSEEVISLRSDDKNFKMFIQELTSVLNQRLDWCEKENKRFVDHFTENAKKRRLIASIAALGITSIVSLFTVVPFFSNIPSLPIDVAGLFNTLFILVAGGGAYIGVQALPLTTTKSEREILDNLYNRHNDWIEKLRNVERVSHGATASFKRSVTDLRKDQKLDGREYDEYEYLSDRARATAELADSIKAQQARNNVTHRRSK